MWKPFLQIYYAIYMFFVFHLNLQGELSKIAEFHFPELNILHPDLGISSFMVSPFVFMLMMFVTSSFIENVLSTRLN